MSRGRAGPLHEHSYMQYGKGMDLVMEVNVQKCSRKWSSIVTSFTSFYFRYDSSIFRFVNSLFYVGWVHLVTVNFPCNSICLFVWTRLAYLKANAFVKIIEKFTFNLWYISHSKRKQTLLVLYSLRFRPIIKGAVWWFPWLGKIVLWNRGLTMGVFIEMVCYNPRMSAFSFPPCVCWISPLWFELKEGDNSKRQGHNELSWEWQFGEKGQWMKIESVVVGMTIFCFCDYHRLRKFPHVILVEREGRFPP
jgi:hypothetical protein